jgi:hypothetical protein
VSHQGDFAQIEVVDHGGQVVGHGVDVVAGGGPVGAAVAAPVIQHAPQPASGERGDLVVELV